MKTRLREFRDKKGLTALTLAERAQSDEMRIFSMERGRFMPTTAEAARIASVLGASITEIFPGLIDASRVKL